jgi:formylmethanofuran dehydrogenase subunit C
MVTITVDCNSDTVEVFENTKSIRIQMKCNHPNQTLELLEEIFNLVDNGEVLDVQLEKIDEDVRTSIGEW